MTYQGEDRERGRYPGEHGSEGGPLPAQNAAGDKHQSELLHARVNVQLADESFRDLVVSDAEGEVSEEEKEFLRSPSVSGRWNTVLGSLNRELQSQFAERRAQAQAYRNECMKAGPKAKQDWFDYSAEYERWRGQTTRLKGRVEERLAESKELIRQHKSRRRSAGTGGERTEGKQAAAHGDGGAEGRAGSANSLPLLSDVAELLSKEGAVREPFAAQRDWLLRRISETFRLVRGRSVSEEAACAASGGGSCTEPQTSSRAAHPGSTEDADVRGGNDG